MALRQFTVTGNGYAQPAQEMRVANQLVPLPFERPRPLPLSEHISADCSAQ
jgi:hypothetical protein